MDRVDLVKNKAQDTAKKAKKGASYLIYSRTAVVVVLLLAQVMFMIAMVNYLQKYMSAIYFMLAIFSAVMIIYILNEKGNPEFKMTWILCVMLFPVFGTLFYLFVKTEFSTRYIGKRLSELKIETAPYMEENKEIVQALRANKPSNANLAYYMSHQIGFPTYRNTEVTYFPLGEDKFEEMIRQMEQAEKFIFMEYFIVDEGYMWNTILEVLERKAAEGVEVRFMYDGMCSIALLPYRYPKTLQKKGLKAKMFSPVHPVLSTHQNNRDHRKICVIDGKVGFTGGINLADEYINRKERFGHWKDTAVMLRGDAVQSLTVMFLQMWNVDETVKENFDAYLTPSTTGLRRELGFVLPYGDSPYDHENVGEEVYFHILNHAKKYVHIMTPYLILDGEMITALTRAAKSNIEVIIIMTHIPDKKYAFALAKTYYEELLEAGVQIYEYTSGFVHAKVCVADDDTATVGTINLDYRSLYLHFECGTFIYQNAVVYDIEEDFQNTLKKCQKISITDVRTRPFISKAAGEILRLVAPLM